MANKQEQIKQLRLKLELLQQRQEAFSKEIAALKIALDQLELKPSKVDAIPEAPQPTTIQTKAIQVEAKVQDESNTSIQKDLKSIAKPKSNIEKFIGENLTSIVGILITVLGVGIGVKYAIDNNWINPLTRIILGYLFGLGLLGFAIRLKDKYHNFSAILLSGSMAILYFVTYAAFSFFDLIPQSITFILMVVFTAFTVLAAINYNRQVIAHIGLVGAYAIPFLLGGEPDQVGFLFVYMAIINAGILFIGFQRYWKSLFYASFCWTWLIFYQWYLFEYQMESNFGLGNTFLAIFFGLFYLTFLSYKLLKKEKFRVDDIILLLANAFIFYGIGYVMIDEYDTNNRLLGPFTLLNGIIHFIVSVVVYRQKLGDRNLFYLVSGLVLVFITIAIPVQLKGNWVTLLWAGEAALLFWLGRTKGIPFYERFAYPLILLTFISLLMEWNDNYYPKELKYELTPILNVNFLTSVLVIAAFGFINWLNRKEEYVSPLASSHGFPRIISFLIPAIFLFVIFYAFRMEIAYYWKQAYANSWITVNPNSDEFSSTYSNRDLSRYKTLWIFIYTLTFLSGLIFLNLKRIQSKQLGAITIVISVLTIFLALAIGFGNLEDLQKSYVNQTLAEYYQRSPFNIGIRYVLFTSIGILLYAMHQLVLAQFNRKNIKIGFDALLHLTTLTVASNELITWMEISGSNQAHQLGLSILWGAYSLCLIGLGIWQKKKHLRLGAIGLFTATLIKLFFYDLSGLDSISKTIVFVSLGILLLIISFLYNKYKHILTDEE